MLVFDFDGVLCDSLEECMMVAWYGHTGAPVTAFVEPGLAGVPAAVVERFERCRPFMRHLLHFLVPLVAVDVPATRAEFHARYAALTRTETERFAQAAERYRGEVRERYPSQWSACHPVQRELAVLVRGAYIATARDSTSVSLILRAHGMGIHDDHVFGSLRSKPAALDAIALRERRSPAEVVLIDDSIENCLAAREAGFATQWASWGYNLPEDAETARGCGITALTVESLLQRRSGTSS